MKTQVKKVFTTIPSDIGSRLNVKVRSLLLVVALMLTSISGFAHCDSYDGPVIKDALTALDQNNVELVLKWIDPQQEAEIISDRKSTRLNSSHVRTSYAVFCLKKKRDKPPLTPVQGRLCVIRVSLLRIPRTHPRTHSPRRP